MGDALQQAADAALEADILDALTEKMQCEIPEVMFDNAVETEKRDLQNRLYSQGLDYQMYLKYAGMTDADVEKQMRPRAERTVKVRLALEAVAAAEKIEVTEDDLNKEYDSIAASYGLKADEIRAQLTPEMISDDVRVKKALELVKEAAVVTDAAPEENTEEKKEEGAQD